jgi:hypothetical protein
VALSIPPPQDEQGITLTVPVASRQALDTIIELRLDGSAMDIPVLGAR